jgi:hypothetical protein
LTSVSPALEDAWKRFTGRPFVILPADPIEIDAWWQAARTTAPVRALDDKFFSDLNGGN